MTFRPPTRLPVPLPSEAVFRLLRSHAKFKLEPDGWMTFRMRTPPHLAPQATEAMCWISRLAGLPIDRHPPTASGRLDSDDDEGWMSLAEMLDHRRDGEG